MPKTQKFFVYVIQLKSSQRLPPLQKKMEVYIGSSAFPPAVRFQKHLTSPKASHHVKRRGVRLLPRLYSHLNPLPSRKAAQQAERALHDKLKKRGYRVYGSCSPRKTRNCWM